MLERILLAAVITFCVYLFLNVGGKSSNTPAIDAKRETIPRSIDQIVSFS